MSTHFNPKYSISKLFATYEVDDKNAAGENLVLYDWLDPTFTRMIEQITQFTNHNVIQGEHLANIAYLYHGTTTTWHIIAAYNGIVQVSDLVGGQVIKVPLLNEINRVLRHSDSQRGTTVVI